MKKWVIGFFVFSLFILSAYLFIPNKFLLSGNISVSATRDGLYRNLVNEENWKKWWPGSYTNQANGTPPQKFIYNDYSYTIDNPQISSLIISISKNNTKIKTYLHIFPDKNNTVMLHWEGMLSTSLNPVRRLRTYLEKRQVNKDVNNILKKMQSYFSKNEHIYGVNIRKEHVLDSILIFSNATSKGFPETGYVYNLIDLLKTHITDNSAHETGFPMLNIHTTDSIDYIIKVAIPVDKRLPSSGDISYKWMLGGGNILVAEVKGGYFSINMAFGQLKNYASDYHHISPAIPFQSLVTDRLKEPDSSKWITRIYYPIMY